MVVDWDQALKDRRGGLDKDGSSAVAVLWEGEDHEGQYTGYSHCLALLPHTVLTARRLYI